MPYDRFLIAPFKSGQQDDLKPFLIPDDAFEELTNAYVHDGTVRKRFGSYLMNPSVDLNIAQLHSRLRINIGTTDVAGDIGPLVVPGLIFRPGQMFSIDDEIFTVIAWGNPSVMLTTGAAAVHTFDTTTGAVVITGAEPVTDVYFYPAQPVMGFASYETPRINDEPVYAFDTQFAYKYVAGGWERLDTFAVGIADATWTGSDSQFFWARTYRGTNSQDHILFVTNYNAADHMRYWNDVQWATFSPLHNAADHIITARIIIPFHGRLLLLNTIEEVGGAGAQFTYINRCRYCQKGSPFDANAWRYDDKKKGDYVDCPIKEAIISAQLFKDRLIVFFEKSTWELVFTGNHIVPFTWQQINIELGAESTFSIVAMDKAMLAIGNVGIHACNGMSVERIDDKISDEVFKIHNDNDGVFRVHGVRDFYTELIYWTIPTDENAQVQYPVFPKKVLVYNYKTGSWAFNDDSITAFGYFQNEDAIRWIDMPMTWADATEMWDSGLLKAKFRQVVAGNQQGFTFIVDSESGRNAPALQITNMTLLGRVITITSEYHNLDDNDYILIENAEGIDDLNGKIYRIAYVDLFTFTVNLHADDPLPLNPYEGGGTIARVSEINILTKQYNFYGNKGADIYLAKVDFNVDRTSLGEVTVDSMPSSSNVSMLEDGEVTGALLGTNVLETFPYPAFPIENAQKQLWHPVYFQTQGSAVQLRIYLNDEQMIDTNFFDTDFQLNAIVFYTTAIPRLHTS